MRKNKVTLFNKREPGTPLPALLKGGEEEKSPYNQHHIKSLRNMLDGNPTIALRFTNIIES